MFDVDVVAIESPVLLLRMEEAAERLGIARTLMFHLVRIGESRVGPGSSTAMAARYQHVTDPIRRDVARRVGGLLWADPDDENRPA